MTRLRNGLDSTARPVPAPRANRPATSLLSFFGLGIAVHGDVPDLAFRFGPHIVHRGSVDLSVEIATRPAAGDGDPGSGNADAPAESRQMMCVRRSDGLPLLRRQLRGRTNVPPLIPPFAAVSDRIGIAPALVMSKGRTTVAIVGSALSPKAQIGLALGYRSWRFVAPQLLVVDRRTGEVLPHLVPLELRGAAIADAPRSGLATGSWRTTTSPLTGEVLLVRPESVGAVERVDARLPRPHVVGLCRTSSAYPELVAGDVTLPTWPSRHKPPPAPLSTSVLRLPHGAVADEAADLLDDWFSARRGHDTAVAS